jgi:hypothetical protein
MKPLILANLFNLPISAAMKRNFMTVLNGGSWSPIIKGMDGLRAFSVAELEDGFIVNLAYHTASAFGGGGLFVWKLTEVRADNNGTIILPTGRSGSGRWVRSEFLSNPGFVDIRWFGARPNIALFDNGPIIDRAIQSLPVFSPGYTLVLSPRPDGTPRYMRRGICYIPPGVWYTQEGIVASGGMTLAGEGPQRSSIALAPYSPGFTERNIKTITALTTVSGVSTYLGVRPMTNITVPAHGKVIGSWVTGFVFGVSNAGNHSDFHNLNTHLRFKVIDANTVQTYWTSAQTGYTFTDARIEFDNWVVDFQIDYDQLSANNTFGTVCRGLSIDGAYDTCLGSSGLYIEGAQQSYCFDVTVSNSGIVGGVFGVASDKLWVANSKVGPGYMCLTGPAIENGLIHSEHHNQLALHTMTMSSGEIIPRPAFYIRGSTSWRARQCQGEDSPYEFVIDKSPGVTVDKFVVNGPTELAKPATFSRNGYETTMLYLSGDSYGHTFGETFFYGRFKNLVNDQSTIAINAGENGPKQDFDTVAKRVGGGKGILIRSAPLLTNAYGHYASDAAAEEAGIEIGATYKVTGGGVAWRQGSGTGSPSSHTHAPEDITGTAVVAADATEAPTASKIVKRDSSGNLFAKGLILHNSGGLTTGIIAQESVAGENVTLPGAGVDQFIALTRDVTGLTKLTDSVTGILPIANGGTGASTASAARTNLGVPASNTAGVTGADAISNIISLTLAEYNAIAVKSESTLYIIT